MGFLDNVRDRLMGTRQDGGARGRDWDEQQGEYYDEGYDAGYADDNDRGYEQDYDRGYDSRYADENFDQNYQGGYEGGYEGNNYRPASAKGFGVDRSGYYTDNHAPLVTLTDVRAQPISPQGSASRLRERLSAASLGAGAGGAGGVGAGGVGAGGGGAQAGLQGLGRGSLAGQGTAAPTRDLPTILPDGSGRERPGSNLRGSSFAPNMDEEIAYRSGLARSEASLSELQEQRMRMDNNAQLDARTSHPELGQMSDPVQQRSAVQSNVVPMQGYDQNMMGATIDLQDRISTGAVHQRAGRRVVYVSPLSYGEAEAVSQELKQGLIVVLDLRSTRPELAKRILDFSFGVVSALDGQVERHIDRVYIFVCNSAVTEAELASIKLP